MIFFKFQLYILGFHLAAFETEKIQQKKSSTFINIHQLIVFLPIMYQSKKIFTWTHPVLHIFANSSHETRRWFRRFKPQKTTSNEPSDSLVKARRLGDWGEPTPRRPRNIHPENPTTSREHNLETRWDFCGRWNFLCFLLKKKTWCESASHFAEWNKVVVEVGGESFVDGVYPWYE